ncbi:MAG: vWA domain-containing protein [Rubripirellula sp.]
MIANPNVALNRMQDALRRMLIRYPYHAEWLSDDHWKPLASVGTMAVMLRRGTPRFFFSPNFVSECDDEELEGVIHHELNHMVFGHPRIDHSKYPNHQALTIAEEITVNEHVPERLPGSPLLLKQFPDLPPLEDTITRYHRLAERNDLEDLAKTLDTHALWKADAENEASETEQQNIRQVLMGQLRRGNDPESLRQLMRGAGQLDRGEVMREIEATLDPIVPIRWERHLSNSVGNRIRRQATFHRPPRRVPERIGVLPGMTCRPEQPHVLVAIDTSSSMQRRHFERVRRELDFLQRKARVTVIQCDKKIRDTYPLRGPLQTITGRGGTDLRPPFEPEILDRIRPDLLVYFTDGDGPVPERTPDVAVLWCLMDGGKRPASWGDAVDLR